MKRRIGITTALLLTLIVMLSCVFGSYAASTIGSVKVDGSTTSYTSLDSLVDKVDDLKGKTFTIEMYSDWGNKRLVIPEKSNATLNMNGHMYNRGLSSYKSDGEVIWVGSNSTFTINGGDTSLSHTVGVYNGTSTSTKNNTNKTFKGGVIAGGYSSNGAGGIHVKSEVNLILNNVTIAGCRAEQNWGSDGYGGGIWLTGEKTNVNLNYSTITGCYAYNDGGGIYGSNKDYTYIYLKDSHIDSNFCDDEGGGIALDGENLGISGSDDSTVSGNASGDDGGGIYLWNDGVAVSGLEISNNRSGGNGGGACTVEETMSFSDVVMKGNSAKKGGAIYNENDNNTINGCTITGNSASENGGGVYVDSDVDVGFKVTGETVIKDNTNGNLYMSSSSSRVNFTLTRGSDVHVGFSAPGSVSMVTEGKVGDTIKNTNCIRYLTCDDSGYWFTYNDAPNKRKIYLEAKGTQDKGKAVVKKTATAVSAEDATPYKAGKVGDYDVMCGYYRYPSMESATEDKDAVFYYSDGYFAGDPKVYNEHLATCSWALNMSGGHLHAGGNEDYSNKHAAARQFLADIGCDDQSIYVNDFNTVKPGTDSIGVSIASKELKTSDGETTGYYLIPIAVRGVGYEAEWASNTTLGDGTKYNGEAQGFAEAAEMVTDEVAYYIDKYDLTEAVKAGKVKFWISGFSRAGAAANLTAKRLVEKYTTRGNKVFAYPCEAPQGGTDKAEKMDASAYYCIHNLINYADLVPLVGPTEMGFKRYGVDHYIPGTEAGSVKSKVVTATRAGNESGVTTVTTYSDNDPILTKKDGNDNTEYTNQRTEMLKQLEMVDSNVVFDDYFHIGAINFVPIMEIYEKGSYKWTEEEYIRKFIEFFQESSIKSRDTWAVDNIKIGTTEYGTIQQAARDSMALAFSMTNEQASGFAEKAGLIMNAISIISLNQTDMINVWDDVIGDWHTLSAAKKQKYITFFWDKLEGTGAFDYLSSTDKANLEKNWPVLADMIFNYVDGDYATDDVYDTNRTMTYSGTLAINMSRILQMHNPEINVSWARSYDGYYSGKEEEYTVEAPSSVDEPEAEIDGEEIDEEGYDGAKTLKLDVPELNGEAIYYTLTANGVKEKEKLYRGGIDLTLRNKDEETETDYEITAYAISRGVKSEASTFNVKVYSHKHQVTVKTREDVDGKAGDKEATYAYEEGQKTCAVANVPKSQFFIDWTITDEDGEDVTSRILDEDQKTSPVCEFVMPTGDKDGFAKYYKLTFTANYGDRIDNIKLTAEDDAPDSEHDVDGWWDGYVEAGGKLPQIRASWTDDGKKVTIDDVVWYYESSDGKKVLCPIDHQTYNYTVYTAEFRIDKTDDRIFSDQVKLEKGDRYDPDTETSIDDIEYSKDPADGSLIVKVTFKLTNDFGQDQPGVTYKKITVNQYDVNAQATATGIEDKVYYVEPDSTFRLIAPSVDAEAFQSWDMLESGISLSDDDKDKDTIEISAPENDATVRAQYVPVVSKVEVTAEEPVANEPMADNVSDMKITVSDTYEIDKENIDTSWSPRASAKTADFDTAYTLYCAMEKVDEGITVTNTRTGDTSLVTGDFAYSDELEVTVNGESALCDTENNIVYYTFHATEERSSNLRRVKNPDDIFGVEYGANRQKIKKLLPETCEIVVADKSVTEAPVTWTTVSQALDDADETDECVWTAKGNVELPETVENKNDVSTDVEVNVHVNGADYAASPQASVDSGKYPSDRVVYLDTDTEGGEIYYTTGTVTVNEDGEETSDIDDPATDGEEYNDDVIKVPISELDENESFVIRAVTKKSGLRTSREAYYDYSFTDELSVPKGETLVYNSKAQIGLAADDTYTISAAKGSGVTIDKSGNATVTKAGEYEVTVKVKDGFKWRLNEYETIVDEETGKETTRYKTTTDDQIVKFTIDKLPITNATVKVKSNKVYTGKTVKPSLTVKAGTVTLKSSDYTAKVSSKKVGTVTVKVTGKGNCKGTSKTAKFKILPKKAVVKKAKAAKKKIKVTMKLKPSKTGGKYYQIQYRAKGAKKWKSVKAYSKTKTIKKLKKGKKYQVRVRACKKVKGKIYRGKWSKIKLSGKVK